MVGLLHDPHLTKRTIISLIIIGFLTISLPIGLYLSQQRQVLKSKAQECQQVCDTQLVCGPTCRPCGDAYPGECDDTGGADVCDGPQECHDEQVNCRQECINPLLAEENPPPEGPGETGGEVIGGIIDNVCHFFDNFLPGDQCGETPQPQPEPEPEQPQPEATVTPTPEENQSTVSPQITSIETLLNGQPADLGTAQIADDDTVTVVVHVPVQLGQDYACRWNFDDGQGDTPPQDCQINKQFPAGFNTISVYLVNSAGEESERKSFSFIVKPPPQISSIDTYLNGQLTNLSGRQVTVGSTVGVVVNVPAELGNDYACRFNIDDGGDSGFSDCQLTQSFDIGSHSISVYVVNNKGKQSQSQSISFVVVEPPPPPVVSGGGSRAEGTQVINQPAEYKTVEEQYTCGAYLVCESDGGYNTTGYAGKYYTNVTSNYTGSNVGCPANTRIYAPDVCPVDQLTVGTKYIPDETFSSTRSFQVKAAQTLYQCEYTQESVVYDCSNGQKCYNDRYSDQSTQCILKPKTPHYHCDPDPECEGKGEGWVPSQASCSESFTKEAYDCFDGKRWYNDFRRAPDTNCAWDKTSFHPEPDSSCRTANLTDSCQKKTDCQQGYYCQTDTGICLQETVASRASIPEFESSIPMIGGVLNGLGAVKDGAGNLISGAVDGVRGAINAVTENPGILLDNLGSNLNDLVHLPGEVVELVANAPVFYKGDQDQVREQTRDGLARIIEANAVDKALESAQELEAANSAACADFTSSYLTAHPEYQGRSWDEYWFQMPQNSPCHREGMVISQDKVDEAVTNVTSIGPIQITSDELTDEQKEQYRQQTLEAFKESLKTLGYDYDAAAETRVIGTCFDTPSLPGGPALSVIGSTFNLPGLCFTTERLVPTDPSGGYIAVAKKEQAIDLAKQLGLDWDNPQTWTDAETKRFFNTLANRDLNFVKTAIEGVIGLPITTHEDMEIALSLCRQVHGNLCELDSTNAGAYLELTQDEYQKAVNLYQANGNPNFQPTALDLLQKFVAIPGATSLGTQDDYGRRFAEQRIANELGISVDELKKVEATFNALDWAGDVTRSGTQEGRAFETKFNERNTEAAINIVTNIIDPTALIGGGIGITKFVTGPVKAKLAARVGVEAAEEVVNRAESALAREARVRAAGEAFDFTPLERQAFEQIDNAAGHVTPFIPDTPENRELVQLTLDGFEDGGRLVRSDGPTTPAVVIIDPVQADFIAVNGVDDVVSNIRNTVSDGLDNLLGRGPKVDNVALRATEDQLDNLSDPVLRDAVRDGVARGEPVEVLANAGNTVREGDVAQTLHRVDAGIGGKELPVTDHNHTLFEDLLGANKEGEVALTVTKDGRIYQLADAPEDGTSAVARLSRDTNGNLQVAELTVSDETSYTVTRQIDQALNDVQPEKEVVIRRDSAEGVDQAIAQSDDLIGGRVPGEDGVGLDTPVPPSSLIADSAVVTPPSNPITGAIQVVVDDIRSVTNQAVEGVKEAIARKPSVQPLGSDELTQRISRVRQAIAQGHVNDPDLIQFWRSTVRDSEGRFSYYQGQVPPSYYRGAQPLPNLADPEIQKYLQVNLDTRDAFLKGLQEGRFKGDVNSFKEWLVDLHTKQAYKSNQLPGEINIGGSLSSTGHTPIIRNDVAKLANKYGDPYANFISNPGQFGLGKTLDLPEIAKPARPSDVVLPNGWVRHFYPPPESYDEYFAAMQKKLIVLDQLGKTAPMDAQLGVIADFYQYAINGRMFREVNQSLYMNMVNGLLEERGLKPIEHGILDFVAMRLEPANFQKYFIEELERAQGGTSFLDRLVGRRSSEATKSVPPLITESRSFDDLYRVIDRQGGINGTQGHYSADEIRSLVNDVKEGRQPIEVLTRTDDLRETVRRLLAEERISPCPVRIGIIPIAYAAESPCPANPVGAIVHNFTNDIQSWVDGVFRREKKFVEIPPNTPQNQIPFINRATDNIREAFPEGHFRVFSTQGSSAILFESVDNPSLVYKVITDKLPSRSGEDPLERRVFIARYVEQEAKKLQILSENGIGPRLIEYIPPTLTDQEKAGLANPNFAQFRPENKVLQNTHLKPNSRTSTNPIIVMEKVDIDPQGFAKLAHDPQKYRAEVERLISIFEKLELVPMDTELVVDKAGRMIFVDAGGISPIYEGSYLEQSEIREWVERHTGVKKYLSNTVPPCPIGFNLIPTVYAVDVPCPKPGLIERATGSVTGLFSNLFGGGNTVIPREKSVTAPLKDPVEVVAARLTDKENQTVKIGRKNLTVTRGLDPVRADEVGGGVTYLIDPGQTLSNNVKMYDIAGDEIDLRRSAKPVRFDDVGIISIDGKYYRIDDDAWLNPTLYPEERLNTNPQFKAVLEDTIEVWNTAINKPEELGVCLRTCIPPEVYQKISNVIEYIKTHSEFNKVLYDIDVWDLASLPPEAQQRALDSLLYTFRESESFNHLKEVINKIQTNQPLNDEDQVFIEALRNATLAQRKVVQGEQVVLTDLNQRFAVANMAEDYLLRKLIPEDAFFIHQKDFLDFEQMMKARGLPSAGWMLPYKESEFKYGIKLSGSKANAGAHFYFSAELDTPESMARILNHERIHNLEEIAKAIRWETAREYPATVGFTSYEAYTEALQLLVTFKGDIDQALNSEALYYSSYATGVKELLNIGKQINLQSGDNQKAAELLFSGLLEIANGKSIKTLEPLERYYDQFIAAGGQTFAERMAPYADSKLARFSLPAREEKVVPRPEVERVLRNLKAEDYPQLFFSDDPVHVKDVKDSFEQSKDLYIKHPEWLIGEENKSDIYTSGIFARAISNDPKAVQELRTALDDYYRNYTQLLKDQLNRGSKLIDYQKIIESKTLFEQVIDNIKNARNTFSNWLNEMFSRVNLGIGESNIGIV